VGRRHLSLAAALAAAVVLAASASAGVGWRELDRGMAPGVAPAAPVASVVLDRASALRLSVRLPAAGRAALAKVDWSRNLGVAVFGEFGCKDPRVAVTGITRRGTVLVVSLVERPLAPGTMECQALYPTYRLLAVPKAGLAKPYPTLARARLG
jgi:hypothetical protein